MDLINECEKLGDYVVNVVEARMGQRQKDAKNEHGTAPVEQSEAVLFLSIIGH